MAGGYRRVGSRTERDGFFGSAANPRAQGLAPCRLHSAGDYPGVYTTRGLLYPSAPSPGALPCLPCPAPALRVDQEAV